MHRTLESKGIGILNLKPTTFGPLRVCECIDQSDRQQNGARYRRPRNRKKKQKKKNKNKSHKINNYSIPALIHYGQDQDNIKLNTVVWQCARAAIMCELICWAQFNNKFDEFRTPCGLN